MTSNEMQVVDAPLTVTEMHNQVQLIQQMLSSVMKVDVHYGKIPGAGPKPTLLKAGAEKIMATFRLSAEPFVEDLSGPDVVRYRVSVRLVSPSGRFVGSGIGECSSDEEKYKWRTAPGGEQQYEETPADRRRLKWVKGWNGQPPKQIHQVRTEPADVANTVLKMAKKRALVDAVLTATAASDVFDQDLEDLPEGLAQPSGNPAAPGVRAQTQAPDKDAANTIKKLEQVAQGGSQKLLEAWQALPDVERARVGSAFGAIKKIAAEADKGDGND